MESLNHCNVAVNNNNYLLIEMTFHYATNKSQSKREHMKKNFNVLNCNYIHKYIERFIRCRLIS